MTRNADTLFETVPRFRNDMVEKLIKTLSNKCDKNIESNIASTNPDITHRHLFSKQYWKSFFADSKERSVFVNIVLIAIQVFAGICGSLLFFVLLLSHQSPYLWFYMSVCISVFISNGLILKWNKNGIYYLSILLFLVILPFIWWDFESFIILSIYSLLFVLTYLGILHIPHKGLSAWKRCRIIKKSFKPLGIAAIAIWIVTLLFFPPLMAISTGFSNDLYINGKIAINARCDGDCDDMMRLANKLAFGRDSYENFYNAELWYKKAIYMLEESYVGNTFALGYYVDYIYFLVKNEQELEANKQLKIATEEFGIHTLREEIESVSFQYDRETYRTTVLSYLDDFQINQSNEPLLSGEILP